MEDNSAGGNFDSCHLHPMTKLIDLCKGQYPVGLFYFDKELWTDDGVEQAAETGADFLVAVDTSEEFIKLCEKYKLGIIPKSIVTPFWWGGDGKKAGTYIEEFPLERFDEIDPPLSPALWGDYFVDEPNSKDFTHINKVLDHYKQRFPLKLPFINLYPNYGRIPNLSSKEIALELGNSSYQEHIDEYLQTIDLPYICFDYYPFTGSFESYLENMDIVARACKKSKKEMWLIIQAGAWKKEDILEAFQLEWQVNVSLAYGARTIIFASYSKGWWDETTSCIDLKGNKNKTYKYVKDIIAFLHSSFGNEFLKYEYMGTQVFGDIISSEKSIKPQLERQTNTVLDFPDIIVESDKAILTGFFRNGKTYALLIVNTHNPFDSTVAVNVKIQGNSIIEKKINSGQSEFIIL